MQPWGRACEREDPRRLVAAGDCGKRGERRAGEAASYGSSLTPLLPSIDMAGQTRPTPRFERDLLVPSEER